MKKKISLLVLFSLFSISTRLSYSDDSFVTKVNPASGVQVSTHTDYYTINGSTLQELREQIDRLGPLLGDRHSDSSTTWGINWSYPYSRINQRCSTGPIKVEVDMTTTFPQWNVPAQTSPVLLSRWESYMAALKIHEEGHRQIAIHTGNEIMRVLSRLSDYPTCEALEQNAKSLGHQLIDQYNQVQQYYDSTTSHGASQGARLEN